MIKAVLFDLDGTLLDREASVRKFINGQYERLAESVGHIAKDDYISRFIELDARGYVWKDKVYQQMVEEFNITRLEWNDLLNDYIEQFKFHCVPFPNLIRMLEFLKEKSLKLGIITNGKGHFQLENIKGLGIEDYFDTILVSEIEGMRKPNVEIFRKALRNLEVDASQAMFIGDHPDNDVKAAMAAGMIGVWKRDDQWSKVEAEFVIEDLLEVIDILV